MKPSTISTEIADRRPGLKLRAGFSPVFVFSLISASLALLVSLPMLTGYFRLEFNVLLALTALPFCIYVRRPGQASYRFAVAALVMLALFPYVQMKLAFFMGLAFALLYFAETAFGKLNSLPVA